MSVFTDDRFILKQMSKIEVQDFNEFAPHYFQYVAKAYEEPGVGSSYVIYLN